jgi:HK97 family phage prohead protease
VSDRDFLVERFTRGLATGEFDSADPDARAILRELHGSGTMRRREFSVRLRSAAGSPRLSGLAAAYEFEYGIGYGMKERLARGAFDASVAQRSTVPLLLGHDWKAPPIGIAHLASGYAGVTFDAELFTAESETARIVHRAAESGALDAVSIGFTTSPGGVETDSNDRNLEVVNEGAICELSVVVKGASPAAKITQVA